MKKELLSIIRTVAPGIATALGGPLAGMATRVISETLLGKADGSAKDIEMALLGASPETMLKLKEADNNFTLEMERLGVDLERVHADDRDSARKMAMVTKSTTTAVLAYLIVFGGFAISILILFTSLSKADTVLAGTIIGYLLSEMKQVTSYHFGTSRGSSEKNATIAGLMR